PSTSVVAIPAITSITSGATSICPSSSFPEGIGCTKVFSAISFSSLSTHKYNDTIIINYWFYYTLFYTGTLCWTLSISKETSLQSDISETNEKLKTCKN